MTLPSRMRDLREMIDAFDISQIEEEIAAEARAQIVIVGPVDSGKSTLFNYLKNEQLSEVSAVPGTTKEALTERFGPFWLVDTPGFGEVDGLNRAEAANRALDGAATAVLVLDAAAGIRDSDARLHGELRALGIPTVVVLNKIDLLQGDVETIVRDAENKKRVPIIPISAKKGTHVAERLIPALIDSHPGMAVTIGRALPAYRKRAASRVIRQSAFMALLVGLEPIPILSIPLMIGVQMRMMLRLATIYGQTMTAARARDLISSIAGGVFIRYAGIELAKFFPGIGWIIAAVVAVTGTVTLGNVAVRFFELAGNIEAGTLRSMFKRQRWSRKNKITDHHDVGIA
ncbi:MAG: GTP-binding protein [Anaerolineae bacterium]